ncbi:Type I secretion membrane fusion protein, HlyD family [Bosea sp. LC85]|uniref:HlyD family type I secretion periplasmic adaptor subunit n=1 Tax=Bosea sp. LC85 TaxID=1502851 RepID=UPI0004E3BE31|nr:HlyD family type I secretion periplasmic adaptor subunit [Bosea sp. LC85]KFC75905.1 Type I secretion membrane fusion protein, HlyD family [Bosea sp. LC85]
MHGNRKLAGPGSPGSSEATEPRESIRYEAIVGGLTIGLFFGAFGTWAVTAPLNGAVIANGVVKVEGNRKSVQHLDGGIVRELRVKEGDRVKLADTLIVLDRTQAQTEHDVLSQQYLVLRATEERLKAELNHAPAMDIPADLKGRMAEQDVSSVWNGQVLQFESRLAALEGQRSVIRERIAQLGHQIAGGEAQARALRAQLISVQKELQSLIPLAKQGLIAQPRFLQVERAADGLEGQIAETLANIARSRQAIAEQRQQIAQLTNDRLAEVTRELKESHAKRLELIPKIFNAQAVLRRTEIQAPYSGRIVGLNVFSVGGVVNRGDKILDIVPEEETLIVEAQFSVEDISDVRLQARAEVHLTAYKQRIIPMIHGTVIQIGADRLTDSKTGNPYYVALVRVDEAELADLPNIQLYPGMPATVMIPTTERTAFDYLVGPLVASFNQSFRQR